MDHHRDSDCGSVALSGQILAILVELKFKLEHHMVSEAAALSAIEAKIDDLIADVRAALAALPQVSELGEEGQAIVDSLTAKLDAFDAEVGDADGSDTPPVEPTEP